jgi:putative NADPH-quinone reductase
MKTLVIAAHPNISQSRINKAWLEALSEQRDVTVHELYRVYPDESIDVEKEQARLEAHERIIFQYPFYWYSTPPLLKRWFDDVLQYGWAYGPGGDKMKGKEIGVAVSTYGSTESYQPTGFNRFTIDELLRPVQALANFIDARYIPHFAINDTSNVTDDRLRISQEAYIRYVNADSRILQY